MKITYVLLVLVLLFTGLYAKEEERSTKPLRLGIGAAAGTEEFRWGMRLWIKDRFGISVQAGSNWDRDVEVGEAQFHYKFLPQKKFSPYVGVGTGLSRVNVLDKNPPAYNSNVWSVSGHLGGELLLGEYRRHGLSLQVDYVNGSLEYKKRNATDIGDGTQNGTTAKLELTPVTGKFLYHFYFLPRVERDKDKDGVKNDRCPDKAEDFDGFKDEDGCPEDDNDGDNIVDPLDSCPNDAEDLDSFQDEDGCPDTDNDNDGITDSDDQCPNEAEDKDSFEDEDGCPDTDNDGDGIPDSEDQCPNEKETANGFHDEDGCFDSVMPEIIQEEIANLPTEAIQFEFDSVRLLETSYPVLDSLVSILQKWSELQIQVEGHTDNMGSTNTNQRTSEKRAEAVKSYLVSKGIDTSRISSVGYGESKPKYDNNSREGRAKNRRVEVIKK